MSRNPPFPTRDPNRPRNNAPTSYSASASAYDSRPQSLVSDASGVDVRNSGIPARPSRSQLRGMPSTPGLADSQRGAGGPPPVLRTRALRRDSGSTTFSDREAPSPAVRREFNRDRDWDRGASTDVESSRRGFTSPTPLSPDDATSPKALLVINALQGAAQRTRAKRQATLESPGTGGFSSASPGGFASYEEMEREEAEKRRREEKRLDEERRERMMGRQRDRQKTGVGRGGRGDIDAILDQVNVEWEFVTKPDFNAVQLALELMDERSMGKDMPSFRSTKRMLERALKGSIQTHAQTFAAALPHHATVLTSLNNTQTSIQETKTALLEMKESLGNRRADLAQLWTRGQTLDEMIKIVDEIEYLKTVPDTLESLISEKKLVQASSLLLKASKIIAKSDMSEIGALADLKAYLSGQETTLREILVDELEAHMYLKTFWCDNRWQSYTTGQQMLPRVDFEEKRVSLTAIPTTRSISSRLATYLHNLNLKPNDTYEARTSNIITQQTDPSLPNGNNLESNAISSTFPIHEQQNPESDSFTYIETILESLAILGKLGVALESVTQRLPMELYSLVEATVEEVDERTEFARRLVAGGMSGALGGRESVVAAKTGVAYIFVEPKRTASMTKGGAGGLTEIPGAEESPTTLLRLGALENSASNADHEVLRDLFWSLYSKMDAVCQSIRVVYEVANRIGTRKDFKDSSGVKPTALFPFPELWEPIEAELRGLILLHLMAEKGGASTGSKRVPSITEVLTSVKSTKDKGWQNFRFGDSDTKLANRLNKQHEEELTRLLKDSVPGLVAGTETSVQVQSALSTAVDDRFASAVPHRLLVSPDAFYVSIIFHPTLAFLDRAADVLPETTGERVRESSSFLDDFVLRVYLPLLEERVASLFLKIVNSPDAFFPDPGWKRLSTRPLIKAATELMALINSLCAMQQTTPFHRDNYSRLILGVIIQFYQRCSDRFKELVSTSSPLTTTTPSTPKLNGSTDEAHVAVAARWAQKLEVAACVSALYSLPDDDVANSRRICRQETRVELNFLTTETVNRDDLVPSKNLHALGNLFHSLIWFMRQLVSMRLVVDDPLSPVVDSALDAEPGFTAVTPHFPLLPPAPPSDQLKLPLTKPMALRFDALMKTYEQLAEYVLATLRIDTRCRTIHFLDLAMRRGNYRVERDAGDPDPHIMDLNLDLGVCDDCANETLPPKERKFLFEGLGTLMEHLLISNSRHIRFANAVGIQKILRNMLAMQQNMKTITDASQDADFERAKIYYNLFYMTPQEMLASIRKRPQFTLEEYKSMLNFQCGVDQQLGERGSMNAVDRNYGAYVTELHALAIEDSTD